VYQSHVASFINPIYHSSVIQKQKLNKSIASPMLNSSVAASGLTKSSLKQVFLLSSFSSGEILPDDSPGI